MSLLQQHQLRVAAFGAYIADHWKHPKTIDKQAIIQTLLLHDMGNIIKFNLDDLQFYSPAERKRVDYWQHMQQEMKQKFHNDEHEATYTIAKELGVSNRVYYLITYIGQSQLYNAVRTDDWEVKLVSYADLRCGPFGIISVNQRFDDIIERYKGRQHHHSNAEKVNQNREYCLEVEKQLQKQITIDLQSITEEKIKDNMKVLRQYDLKVNTER